MNNRHVKYGDLTHGPSPRPLTQHEALDVFEQSVPIVNAYRLGELDKTQAEAILADILKEVAR